MSSPKFSVGDLAMLRFPIEKLGNDKWVDLTNYLEVADIIDSTISLASSIELATRI